MELQAAMDALRSKGKPNTVKIYQRHGVTNESFGVAYADLGALVKKIKVDHDLALALWDTGVHDARLLATKIADPARMTRKQIEGWLEHTGNYIVNGAVAGLAGRMPKAADMARAWIESADEWKGAAGWIVMTELVMNGHIEEDEARQLIDAICERIHGAKNRTRYSMNNTLIAIGGSMAALRDAALEAARAIGKVEVDHGQTGCKTPDAVGYIERMVKHAAGRKTAKKKPAAKAAKKATKAAAPKAKKAAAPKAKKAATKKAATKKTAAPGPG